MLRIRLDYTAMLEELHAKSIKHVFRNGQAKEEAFQQWRGTGIARFSDCPTVRPELR